MGYDTRAWCREYTGGTQHQGMVLGVLGPGSGLTGEHGTGVLGYMWGKCGTRDAGLGPPWGAGHHGYRGFTGRVRHQGTVLGILGRAALGSRAPGCWGTCGGSAALERSAEAGGRRVH